MTETAVYEEQPVQSDALAEETSGSTVRRRRWFGKWNLPTIEILAVVILALIGAIFQAHGSTAQPPPINDDEGTYVAQAWAVLTGLGPHHTPAQYTYWYDHPPFGWIQVAVYAWITGMFAHGHILTTLLARRMMTYYFFVDELTLYYILRRLGANTMLRFVGVALFVLTPLSLFYLRQVFLDTIATPWLLLSIAAMVSKRSWLGRAVMSGGFLGIAVLSKETLALFLPAAIVYIWLNADGRVRRYALVLFFGASGIVVAFYFLFAILRGELLPGPNHTSLIGAIEWQLVQRGGGGNVLIPGTLNNSTVETWFGLARPFIYATVVSSVLCLTRRSTAFIGVSILIGTAMLFRSSGYLPAMFITAYIAQGVLSIVLSSQILIDLITSLTTKITSRVKDDHAVIIDIRQEEPVLLNSSDIGVSLYDRRTLQWQRWLSIVLTVLLSTTGAYLLYPTYKTNDTTLFSNAKSTNFWLPLGQAERWIGSHISRKSVLLTDDYVWTDFVDEGFAPTHVVWVWKYGSDPEVVNRYPNPLRDITYIISTENLRSDLILPYRTWNTKDESIVRTNVLHRDYYVFEHSKVIKRFGSGYFRISIREVINGPAVCTQQCLEYALE